MESEKYSAPNFNEEYEIKSLSDYIEKINLFNLNNEDNIQYGEDEGKNDTIVFRGQKAEFWNVMPSIFRNNFISNEHELMLQPFFHIPSEFNQNSDLFETMTKYQHYGMCTRLLDLTTNPLVALYFACEEYGKVKYLNEDEPKEPYGVIYFCRTYPMIATDSKIKIISSLAKMNLNQNNKYDEVLSVLFDNKIITKNNKEKWCSEGGFEEFIDIIQGNYIVKPVYSNERLIKQSGMFMLPGCFAVNGDSPKNMTIEKRIGNLKSEFNGFFYISGENKKKIIQELDRCNINEAALFPELEHQLKYIRDNNKIGNIVPNFEKYEKYKADERNNDISDSVFKSKQFFEYIEKMLLEKYEDKIVEKLLDNIQDIINKTDWYKIEKYKSLLKVNLARTLMNFNISEAKEAAIEIEKNIIDIAEKTSFKEE